MWDAAYMSDNGRTALQNLMVEIVDRLPNTRDHYDSKLREILGSSSKPLWDIERGKVKKPSPRILRAIEQVLSLEPDSLVDLVHPRDPNWASPALVRVDPDQPVAHDASQGETAAIISLDLSVSMGPGTPIEDFVEENPIEFDIGLLRALTRTPFHRLRVIRGIGSSMEPKFKTGDRFLIDTTDRNLSRIDGYYWITLWGAHGLKRLRPAGRNRVLIISEADDHDNIEVDAGDMTIEGRAIWLSREL